MAYAERLASLRPEAVQATKRTLNQWLKNATSSVFEHGLALEFMLFPDHFATAGRGGAVKLLHVYTGSDGRSHFADREFTTSLSALGASSSDVPASTVAFRETGHTTPTEEFRPAPRRQLVVLLQGRVEYECGDGSTRECGVGDVVFFDDTGGQGHRARVLEGPRVQIFVRLPADADVMNWTRPRENNA